MDSQFRCGKCSKPISSKYAKCPGCGSLGPHTFTGSPDSSVEGGLPAEHKPGRRDYPAELVDRQPSHAPHPPEKFKAPEPVDISDDVPQPHAHPIHDVEDGSRFPAGMKTRSPILNYVEDMDESSEKPEGKKRRRRDRDTEEDDEVRYKSRDEDEDEDEDENEQQEKHASEEPNDSLTWVIGIILVLILIIAAIYAINNYEELTKWLASPTVPDIFKQSK